MKINEKFTINELVDFIQSHEKEVVPCDDQNDYLKYLANSQWRFELASMDHLIQRQFIDSSNAELDKIIQSNSHRVPLVQMLDETLIVLDLKAETKSKAFSELAKLAYTSRVATSYEELYLELENREKCAPTAIGHGVAIPHSRFPHQKAYPKPKLIIARSRAGIPFDAPDHQKVDLIFMPCAPTQFVHMRMIAQIIKMVRTSDIATQLRNIKTKGDLISTIKRF